MTFDENDLALQGKSILPDGLYGRSLVADVHSVVPAVGGGAGVGWSFSVPGI